MGYSPWGCKDSDTTERLHFYFHSHPFCSPFTSGTISLFSVSVISPFSDSTCNCNHTVGLKLNIRKTKIMASGPITSWHIEGEEMEVITDFVFLGSKITADSDCNHEIKRCLLLRRKAMTNLGSILKTRDIALLTKVYKVKAVVFPVGMC